MNKSRLVPLAAYLTTACLSLGAAFLVSMRFVNHLHAQEAGAPPGGAAPAPSATPPPNAGTAPDNSAPPPTTGAANPGAPTPSTEAPPPPPPTTPAATNGVPPANSASPGNAAGGVPPTGASPPAAGTAPNPDTGTASGGTAAGAPGEATNSAAISELEGFLEPFIYDVVNRRDPFQAYAEYVPQDVSSPSRPLSPAQRFDLDQLRLVGIMWDIRDPKAMFMDPEQEVMVLGRDEGIGNRNGYIASIREGEVVVIEAIRKRGDIIYKTRVLRIER